MTRHAPLVAGLLAAALAGGCSRQPPPIVPVEGRVTLDGRPLPRAEVRFYPVTEFGGEYIAVGETDDDGRFKLSCPGRPGACACENRVTVAEAPLPEELRGMTGEAQLKASRYLDALKNRPIPPKYATLAQSPLAVTVAPGQTEYNLELNR